MRTPFLTAALLITLCLLAGLAHAQDAIPVPHGIDGYVYVAGTSSMQVPAGTAFSVNDTTSGFYFAGVTGKGPFPGRYSVAINGADGDALIVRAWTNFSSAVRTATLQGALHDINVYLNTTPPPANATGPPVFTSQPPSTATVGAVLAYTAVATNPGGAALTYSLLSGPQGASVSAGGVFSWTPTTAQAGAQLITLVASDGTQSATQSFSVQVSLPPNTPPAITSGAPTQATAGQQYQYQMAASDPDGDTLSYALLQSPNGMAITQSGLITWTPADAQVGSADVIAAVQDGKGGSVTQNFSIAVFPSNNHPPSIISTAPTSATQGATYAYYVDAYDPDGDTLTYSLPTAPSGMSIHAQTGLLSWTPDQAGSFAVTVQVTDTHGASAVQDFTLVVAPAPASATQFVVEGVILSADGSSPAAAGTQLTLNDTDSGLVLTQQSGNASVPNSFSFAFSAAAGQHVMVIAQNATHRGGEDFTLSQQTTNLNLYLSPVAQPAPAQPASASSASSTQTQSASPAASAPSAPAAPQQSFSFSAASRDVAVTQVSAPHIAQSAAVQAQQAQAPSSPPTPLVYQYVSLAANASVSALDVTFRVSKQWVQDNHADVSSVALYQNGTSWAKLLTSRADEDAAYYYFDATASGPGTFAIAAHPETAPQGAPIPPQFPLQGRILLPDGSGDADTTLVFTNLRTGEKTTVTTGTSVQPGSFSVVLAGNSGDHVNISIDGATTYTLILGSSEGTLDLVYYSARRALVPLTGALVAPPSSGPLSPLGSVLALIVIAAGMLAFVILKKTPRWRRHAPHMRTLREPDAGDSPQNPSPAPPLPPAHAPVPAASATPAPAAPQKITPLPRSVSSRVLRPAQFFYLHDGTVLTGLHELSFLLEKMDDDLFAQHVSAEKNDFASWAAGVFGAPQLASAMRKAHTREELKRVLDAFLGDA